MPGINTYHGRTVVIVFMSRFPRLKASPAKSMVTFGTGHTVRIKWYVLLYILYVHFKWSVCIAVHLRNS